MKQTLFLLSLITLSLLIIPFSGCTKENTGQTSNEGSAEEVIDEEVVEVGDYVKVHYTGTLDDGSVFDSSEGREPLEFTAGAGQMIKGFDAAVIGMKIAEVKTVTIPAEDAYGIYDDTMVLPETSRAAW